MEPSAITRAPLKIKKLSTWQLQKVSEAREAVRLAPMRGGKLQKSEKGREVSPFSFLPPWHPGTVFVCELTHNPFWGSLYVAMLLFPFLLFSRYGHHQLHHPAIFFFVAAHRNLGRKDLNRRFLFSCNQPLFFASFFSPSFLWRWLFFRRHNHSSFSLSRWKALCRCAKLRGTKCACRGRRSFSEHRWEAGCNELDFPRKDIQRLPRRDTRV